MKGLKTTLISILAIGLLAGSPVGVAAQDEEAADPMRASTFKWSFDGQAAEFIEPTVVRLRFGAVQPASTGAAHNRLPLLPLSARRTRAAGGALSQRERPPALDRPLKTAETRR